jgi:hypothetical protein
MHLPERAIFRRPPFTQTQDVHLVALLPTLDLDP